MGGLPPIWNIPHPRNANFTGREGELRQLRNDLTGGHAAAIVPIAGLGGAGKTQLALEYAYRHIADYDAVWWVRAEDSATLTADIALLAGPLKLPESGYRRKGLRPRSSRGGHRRQQYGHDPEGPG